MLADELSVSHWAEITHALRELGPRTVYATLAYIHENGREEQVRRYQLDGEPRGSESTITDCYNELEDGEPYEALRMWLSGQLLDQCLGLPHSRLRLRLYGDTGHVLKSRMLVVHYNEPEPSELPTKADVVLQQIALNRAEREEETQAGFYQQMLDAMRQLRGLMSDVTREMADRYQEMNGSLSEELRASRIQVNALVESITHAKIAHAEAEARTIRQQAATVVEDQRSKVAQDLGKQAIDQVGQLVGLLAMKQSGVSVDPQLAGVLGALQKNPQFSEAMKNPGVVQMLQDPGNVEYLAGWLKDAAEAIKGAQPDATATQQTPTPEPADALFDTTGGDGAAASREDHDA